MKELSLSGAIIIQIRQPNDAAILETVTASAEFADALR